MPRKIIEIDGVKLEVDLREAQTIDTYKVGDLVKLLVPKYSNEFVAAAGVIIGFDDFQKRPTIVVAYLESTYGEAKIEIAYVFSGSKHEITHASEGDVPFSKKQIEDLMDVDIAKHTKALQEAVYRKEKFQAWFGKYFEVAADAMLPEGAKGEPT